MLDSPGFLKECKVIYTLLSSIMLAAINGILSDTLESECLSYWNHNKLAPPGTKQLSNCTCQLLHLECYFCSDDAIDWRLKLGKNWFFSPLLFIMCLEFGILVVLCEIHENKSFRWLWAVFCEWQSQCSKQCMWVTDRKKKCELFYQLQEMVHAGVLFLSLCQSISVREFCTF